MIAGRDRGIRSDREAEVVTMYGDVYKVVEGLIYFVRYEHVKKPLPVK